MYVYIFLFRGMNLLKSNDRMRLLTHTYTYMCVYMCIETYPNILVLLEYKFQKTIMIFESRVQ
jgi:hypothetical protein